MSREMHTSLQEQEYSESHMQMNENYEHHSFRDAEEPLLPCLASR